MRNRKIVRGGIMILMTALILGGMAGCYREEKIEEDPSYEEYQPPEEYDACIEGEIFSER